MKRGRTLGPGRLWKREGRKGNAVWVLDWLAPDGRRRRQVLSSDRRVAELQRMEIIRKRDMGLAGLAAMDGENQVLADLRAQYLAELASRATKHHVENSRRRLDRILSELKVARVRDLKAIAVVQYRSRRKAGGASNRTANQEVDTLRSMLTWAVRVGLVFHNPLQSVDRLPQSKDHQRFRRRALSEEEIVRFLRAAEEDDRREADRRAAATTIGNGTKGASYGMRQRRQRIPQALMWTAFLETGARWSELTRATWADLNEANGMLTLRAELTKSKRERHIPVRTALIEQLRALRSVHTVMNGQLGRASDRIFLSPDGKPWPRVTRNAMRILDRVFEAAGISKHDEQGRKLDIHALRHTFGTRLARAGVGLIQAQKLLGHSDPKLTAQVYTHLEAEDLRGAVERLPVREGGGGGAPDNSRINLAHGAAASRRCARKSLQDLERATGFEPATFSLGS